MKLLGVSNTTFAIMTGFMTPATILSHSNLTASLPKSLAWLVISPNSHRIHHAKDKALLNKNFGGYTLLWDKVFGTYVDSEKEVSEVGVPNHQTDSFFLFQFFDFLKK